jgi:hypothetical protein
MTGATPAADAGRVVVVAAGFALWTGGRCVAAARWTDIRRLRAYRREGPSSAGLWLGVELVDGSVMELLEEAPGFDAFLDRASQTLSGMLPFRDWDHALAASPGDDGVVLFERRPTRY